MPLSVGDKLGPYEIITAIGAGGMGEVWKARDTRLNRFVAIKTSGEKYSERFEREMRAIASLSHPNVCALYDVGPDYLVMELLEGQTLAARDTSASPSGGRGRAHRGADGRGAARGACQRDHASRH